MFVLFSWKNFFLICCFSISTFLFAILYYTFTRLWQGHNCFSIFLRSLLHRNFVVVEIIICVVSVYLLLPVSLAALFCQFYVVFFIPPPNEVGGGVYWIHLVRPSVRLSVCPSVCRRHGFRSISQVCFGISISNFICMLTVAIGRSLLIFSDVTFKMAAWRPYWIFWFPDSNLTSALNINFKLQRHNTYVYG